MHADKRKIKAKFKNLKLKKEVFNVFGNLSIKYADFLYKKIMRKNSNKKQRRAFEFYSALHWFVSGFIATIPYALTQYYISCELTKANVSQINGSLVLFGFLAAYVFLFTGETECIIGDRLGIQKRENPTKHQK